VTNSTPINTPTDRSFRFSAGWAARPGDDASFAHLVEPTPGAYGTHAPYIALFLGGHTGIRVSIHDPDTADALARLLAGAATRFRTARDTDTWDDRNITPPDPANHAANNLGNDQAASLADDRAAPGDGPGRETPSAARGVGVPA
jgi:hypothetical protein